MSEESAQSESSTEQAALIPPVRSLKELIDRVTGRNIPPSRPLEESGVAEVLPFPFLAIVGQREMKLALLLALINPAIGGVLLFGPRGTGKTTAVRSLVDLLPMQPRSLCYYGCLAEDIESGGIDAVCPDCAKKYALGEPLATLDKVRLIELPLNAKIDDILGWVDEGSVEHERLRLRRGLLAQADRNILYVDEVNLLNDDVIDALLDAAAQGSYTIRRGPIASTYWSRFVLVGSMNPEEGRLRPQIQDRFGLRVIIRGLQDSKERLEAYRRVHSYLSNQRQTVAEYQSDTELARQDIQTARDQIDQVVLSDEVANLGLTLVNRIGIDSLRAEIALFEAARAYTIADGRKEVTPSDLQAVSLLALRLRRSSFITDYFVQQDEEDNEIIRIQEEVLPVNAGTIMRSTPGGSNDR